MPRVGGWRTPPPRSAMRFTVAAGRSSPVSPSGQSRTARRCWWNCEVAHDSRVMCPELCGRRANSLSRSRAVTGHEVLDGDDARGVESFEDRPGPRRTLAHDLLRQVGGDGELPTDPLHLQGADGWIGGDESRRAAGDQDGELGGESEVLFDDPPWSVTSTVHGQHAARPQRHRPRRPRRARRSRRRRAFSTTGHPCRSANAVTSEGSTTGVNAGTGTERSPSPLNAARAKSLSQLSARASAPGRMTDPSDAMARRTSRGTSSWSKVITSASAARRRSSAASSARPSV